MLRFRTGIGIAGCPVVTRIILAVCHPCDSIRLEGCGRCRQSLSKLTCGCRIFLLLIFGISEIVKSQSAVGRIVFRFEESIVCRRCLGVIPLRILSIAEPDMGLCCEPAVMRGKFKRAVEEPGSFLRTTVGHRFDSQFVENLLFGGKHVFGRASYLFDACECFGIVALVVICSCQIFLYLGSIFRVRIKFDKAFQHVY